MASLGTISLTIALLEVLVSVVCLMLIVTSRKAQTERSRQKTRYQKTQSPNSADAGLAKLQFVGIIMVWTSALALSCCCVILLIGFLGSDNSILYVAEYRSYSDSGLAWLYRFSGLWAGRGGSLLFWAWLISVFNSLVALRTYRISRSGANNPQSSAQRSPAALDCSALAVAQIVLLIFLAILMLDTANRPFIPTPAHYLDDSGALLGNAALWGLNPLLEHWAMTIHPPLLFIGYAGMTIPFAYALAALIVKDASKTWVLRSERFALAAWLFLGAGIGLGSVWAYVVLGWGGYWGWDPVENASLLPWGIAIALTHSMTNYKKRGSFKRWTVMLACLSFAFVIVGTFITRSGIVESVHAFEGSLVSLVLFGILMLMPLAAGAVGLILRYRAFADETTGDSEAESLASKDMAYFFNNIVMLVSMIALLAMTLLPALTSWLPAGSMVLPTTSFDAIARPIGVIYCLIVAICPLLAWKKTPSRTFIRQARIPAICAFAVFILLCVFFARNLLPNYLLARADGGAGAQALLDSGPLAGVPMLAGLYYFALSLLGFLTASLLVFNSLVLLIRAIAKRNLGAQTIGGFLAHMAMGVILVGLIGSSMYNYERVGFLANPESPGAAHNTLLSSASDSFMIKDYTLTFVAEDMQIAANGDDVIYSLTLAVEKDGVALGQLVPSLQISQATNFRVQNAAVLSLPGEDLFVVYQGVDELGDFALDVRINPLIWFVWTGFGLLLLGTGIAAFGNRKRWSKDGHL